jgi:uncharacterized membrane protein
LSFIRTVTHIFDVRYIGTCPTCMRISFCSMILSWCCLLGNFALDPSEMWLSLAASVVFTLLWLLHITRRALLVTYYDKPSDPSRRLALRFALSVAGAAATSAAFPGQARADSACGGWGPGSDCEPCSNYGRGECMKQNAGCGCYYCHSCGADCPQDNVC